MTNKFTTFEDWLKSKHMDGYMGTDDNAPDAFDDWFSNMDAAELTQYAEKFGEELQLAAAVEIVNALSTNK